MWNNPWNSFWSFLKFWAFVSLVHKEFAPELINAEEQMAFILKYLLA